MANLTKQLLAELKRDKRKTAVMATLLLVAVALTGRLILRADKPATAMAARTAVSQTPRQQDRTAVVEVSDVSQPGKERDLGPVNTTITRDIFVPNPAYFPPAEAKPVTVSEQPRPGMDDLAAERAGIQAQARQLALQSTVLSAVPTAIIEGQVLREGDFINGYRILEVGSRQCTLEKNGVKVVIEMK